MGTPKTTMANLIRHIYLFQVVVPKKRNKKTKKEQPEEIGEDQERTLDICSKSVVRSRKMFKWSTPTIWMDTVQT